MTTETDVNSFEALEQLMLRQRAIRLFDTSIPVDDAVIERAIRAATFAPNGGNRQPCRFIVIRDTETKRKLGVIFDQLGATLTHEVPERTPWEEVPVLVAVITEKAAGVAGAGGAAASVYPAVQNFLLATQGQGLGSVLTTRWMQRAAEVHALMGLPENFEAHAILPVGWPIRRYGRGKRLPVAKITFRERYGQPWA
jgi:nitroreductase